VGLAAAAAGVSIALITQDGDTTATIGDVAVGTDVTGGTTIGSLVVNADADISPTATAYSVQAGIGLGLSGAVAITKVKGATSAKSGAHGSVGSGSTAAYCGSGSGVCINAKGTHTGVDADSFNIVTGAFALGITRTEAVDSRSTEAIVTGGTISASGDYQVLAYSSHHAVANAPSASGGLVSLSAMLPTATV
jgi:mucin-19